MDVEVTHDSDADPTAVWAVMTDLDRTTEVLSSVTSVQRLDGGDGFGVGTRWRETRTMFGREATEELEVTSLDEQARVYVVEADDRGTHYTSTMSVSPRGDGSTLRMTFGGESSGMLGRLAARTIGRAFEGQTRKALAKDLAEIAAAAEVDQGRDAT